MKLSKNFYLSEFLVSQTAARHDIDMTPDEKVIQNLQRLVDNCLQPLRSIVDVPIFIQSGYRPLLVNRLVGGSLTSSHLIGLAADIKVVGHTPEQVCEKVLEIGLPFDQLIQEFGMWTHISYGKILRKQALTAIRLQGRTRYVPGIHPVKPYEATA